MPISLSLLTATLSCSLAELAPAETTLGRLCTRAYRANIETLTIGFERSGTELPRWPSEATYLERCLALGLNEAQLACLDPDRVVADPAGCDEVMEPVKPKADKLTRWFMSELRGEGPQRRPEGETSEGDKP
ncbi:MAG TPA: hypothetical protein ENK18_23245 [Deltaproteobacteria bacterium]|nr:hypothetical protein [Deltaproteobacteria bacterium]